MSAMLQELWAGLTLALIGIVLGKSSEPSRAIALCEASSAMSACCVFACGSVGKVNDNGCVLRLGLGCVWVELGACAGYLLKLEAW